MDEMVNAVKHAIMQCCIQVVSTDCLLDGCYTPVHYPRACSVMLQTWLVRAEEKEALEI